MDKFIKTFEGVFDAVTCQSLIDIFEDSVYQEKIENDGRPNFTQVNLNDHKEYSKFTQLVTYKIVDLMRLYKEGLEEYTAWWPHKVYFEQLRIKKYSPDTTDMFDVHVDVQDHASSKRYLAFLVYLNSGFDGGETCFPCHDLHIKAEPGKVLVFPPTWQYPHIGLPVTEKPKYIMSTYLHYN